MRPNREWGIPFVLVGLYLIVGRFFADARQRERTIYAVTSDRIIIISGLLKETIKSLTLRTLPDISLSERGTGTISFGSTPLPTGWPSNRSGPPVLEGIANARSVYETIRKAQKAAG